MTLDEIIEHTLRNIDDSNVVVGPLVWKPGDTLTTKTWYFHIAISERGRGFTHDQIVVGGKKDRAAVIARLTTQQSLRLHVIDDELEMAKLCEALWPGERVAKLRAAVEEERRNEIIHVADLPFGYKATFHWRRDEAITIEWQPDLPKFNSARAQRRFFEAYRNARRTFFEIIATHIGGTAMVADLDGQAEAIRPAVKH